jgi:hypothetical protein
VNFAIRLMTAEDLASPLLRYNLRFLSVIRNYMPDYESCDSGALLEWTP